MCKDRFSNNKPKMPQGCDAQNSLAQTKQEMIKRLGRDQEETNNRLTRGQ